MANRKHKTTNSAQGTPLQLFLRKLHSDKNLRKGMSIARATLKPEQSPLIVHHLSRMSLYESLLAPMAFPKPLTAITTKHRLGEISTEGELMWCASVLSLYAHKLSAFVIKRDACYRAYLNADYDQAERILNSIQESFGFSLWLLGNRLQLLQVAKGLQAQKSSLEELLSTEEIDQFIAWVTYFLSVRAEDNISYSSFELEVEEVLEIPWLRDYVLLHLLPYNFTSIGDPPPARHA